MQRHTHNDFRRWAIRYWRYALAGSLCWFSGMLVALLGSMADDWHAQYAGACMMVAAGTYLAARTMRVAVNALRELKEEEVL